MRLYEIPAHLPFLGTLAAGVLRWVGQDDPLALSRTTILLPTRRAALALRESFLREAGGRTLLLPRMHALSGLSTQEADELSLPALLDLPPAVEPAVRHSVLTALVMRLPSRFGGPDTPEQAWRLATALAEWLDETALEGCDMARLDTLVPEEFATHWQVTLTFLRGVLSAWEAWLAEQGLMDIGPRRVAALRAQAEAWKREPPQDPVIAAGIGAGGTIPAAAALLKVVAQMPQGCVVLHGAGEVKSEALWAAIGESPTHPLSGQVRLLSAMDATPKDLMPWPGGGEGDPALQRRAALIACALRPAAGIEAWLERRPEHWRPALEGLTLLDAPDVQAEAVAIALRLREALETPGARAALITPDRELGRRVAAELLRHGVVADDSAGQPLGQTPTGAYLRLLARAVAEGFAPVPLLALLKHPLSAGGMTRSEWMEAVRLLERRALRGPRPAPGLDGLRARVAEALRREKDAPLLATVEKLLSALEAALQGFSALPDSPARPPADLLEAHLNAAEALAAARDRPGGLRLYAGEEGEPLAVFLSTLPPALRELPPMSPASWPALFDVLLEGPAAPGVRIGRGREHAQHPRIAILGLLEARLQDFDLAVLGSLEEGVWPQSTDPGPWMSRPMRGDFGLPEPEARIGRVAADFMLAASCAPRVVLARARKRAGAPTVPSRWLTRLETFLGGQAPGLALPRERALDWASRLDMPEVVKPWPRPAPAPPPEDRPREISVTEVADLMADPYGFYARRVLRLLPLEPLDAEVGASDYGQIVHQVMADWTRRIGDAPGGWPGSEVAARFFAEAAEAALAEAAARPGLLAFWRPRLARIGGFVVAQEEAAQQGRRIRRRHAELPGHLEIAGKRVKLKVRADRLDELADGTIALIDYKTGTPPTGKEMTDGRAPQMPLEAAIAEAGGFQGIAGAPVSGLAHWRLTGGGTPGEVKPVKGDPGTLGADALEQTTALVQGFLLGHRRFIARPHPRRRPQRSEHDHLARFAEWGTAEDV